MTVMDWSPEVIDEWVEDVWPNVEASDGAGLWPSERRPVVSEDRINAAFARTAEAIGLAEGLTLHCLRHSYVTHLKPGGVAAHATFDRWRERGVAGRRGSALFACTG